MNEKVSYCKQIERQLSGHKIFSWTGVFDHRANYGCSF